LFFLLELELLLLGLLLLALTGLLDELFRALVQEDELDDTFISPESGILAIRRVLEKFDLELSTLYGVSLEGEEVVTDIGKTKLYILYNPTDDGRYEFYAEIGDEERMEELLSDEEFEEEEE
jgi:hypothetical protein